MKKQWMLAGLAFGLAALGATGAQAAVYEQAVILNCGGTGCSNAAPMVPVGKTLTINTVSCNVHNSGSPVYAMGELWTSSNSFSQYFAANLIVGPFTVAPVQNVAKQFSAGQYPQVTLTFGNSQTRYGDCMLRGTIVP